MANKTYNEFPPGTYDPTKIFLQADPTTGALEKIFLPAPDGSDNYIQFNTSGLFDSDALFQFIKLLGLIKIGPVAPSDAHVISAAAIAGTPVTIFRAIHNDLTAGSAAQIAISLADNDLGTLLRNETDGANQTFKLLVAGSTVLESTTNQLTLGRADGLTVGPVIKFTGGGSANGVKFTSSNGITLLLRGSSSAFAWCKEDNSAYITHNQTASPTTQIENANSAVTNTILAIQLSASHTGTILDCTTNSSTKYFRVTKQGIIPFPRTTAQRTALTGMIAGTMVYDSTLKKMTFWNGAAWEVITSV